MISYLIKVTVIWTIFLCLYEWLSKRNPSFTLNRVYLFGALAAGLIVPLITLDIPIFESRVSGVTAINNGIRNLDPVTATTSPQVGDAERPVDWYGVIKWLYIAGAILLAIISFREVVLILRTAIYGQFKVVNGHRIFSSTKNHAPFSFMGWIFIAHPEQYTDEELNYILRHEDGHNSRKHWLDMIMMQIVFVVFWFHPLVWRFRHLLKLTHEYEADKIAADDNAYDYGHFLLQQTLLKGTPSIAHSFHFSPIKNRITMLTNTKKNSWKYTLAIPVLLTCTFVFAKSNPFGQRVRVGDVTTYNGHRFYWSNGIVDSTQVVDPVSGETTWAVGHRNPEIGRMNNDTLYNEDIFNMSTASIKPQFRYQRQSIHDYLKMRLKAVIKQIPDSLSRIIINNVVLDKHGKIVYFDMLSFFVKKSRDGTEYFSSSLYNDTGYLKILDEIIEDSPAWMPGIINGKAVPTFIPNAAVVEFKPTRYLIRTQ